MVDIIVGYGEVGRAMVTIITQANHKVFVEDPLKGLTVSVPPELTDDVVLHICFPHQKNFVAEVKEYITRFNPVLTIIHSTVAIGTTRLIGGNVAYSFVRGRHPNLAEEMICHTRHVGALNLPTLRHAATYLGKLRFIVRTHGRVEEVEFGKLWDTTYYGICILAAKLGKEMADHFDINWDDIRVMNKTYNEGSRRVGFPEWVRPDLDPIPGPIGGHCVVPNAKIFQESFTHPLLDMIVTAK